MTLYDIEILLRIHNTKHGAELDVTGMECYNLRLKGLIIYSKQDHVRITQKGSDLIAMMCV